MFRPLVCLLAAAVSFWVVSAVESAYDSGGILTCHPGVTFLRDCGNSCACNGNGQPDKCTQEECAVDFETSQRDQVNAVYRDGQKWRGMLNDSVYTCVPRARRSINNYGGTCFCTTNGKSEICSQRPSSPWGR